ncbi:MAG: hypothetical protein J6A63_09735 [Clostridia bacterium]|nr:hypothetical protein [Clostridia bacterium]
MRVSRKKATLWYYLLVIAVLAFLFFTNDFGTLDVQKTAIVMAVGVDKEEDEFILTAQIAIPQSSTQGKASKTQQLTSRGKTIAQAFRSINAKTGWYPKLVFCNLILLGNTTLQQNAFDALEFFFLDEYLSDDCLVAACENTAKEILDTQALVDESSSLAIQKVLSAHAERVGAVLPCTLREFAIGYYGDSHSSFLPIVKAQPTQEKPSNETSSSQNSSDSSSQESSSTSSSLSENSSGGEKKQEEKPVFSAGETALLVGGRQVGTFTKDETFAFNAVKNKLRLAAFDVETNGETCSLTIKHNSKKTLFLLGANDVATLKISVKLTAGLLDNSAALPLEKSADVGDVPDGAFVAAEKRLSGYIFSAFDKCKSSGCDLFELKSLLQKYANKKYQRLEKDILQTALLDIKVQFVNVR